MKIALVSDAVLPFNKGGKETRIYHLTTEMVKRGHSVHIYTMKWWDGSNDYAYEGVQYHALSHLYPLYKNDRRSIRQGLLFGISCLKMITRDFDILEVDHMPFFPLYAAKVVSILKRRPLYATWHEVWGLEYWRKYLGNVKGSVAYLVEKISVKMPDHIIAVSKQTEDKLRTELQYKGPLSLVINGIDSDQITPIASAKEKSQVIFIGRLMPHKNIDILIESIAIVRKKNPAIRCHIIGGGPDYDRLQSLITQLGLAENVKMFGFIESSEEVIAHMKASKVFVLPSSREGFGISILEALACGLRVVTVNHPDNAGQFLVKPTAGTVCDLTAAALAQGITTELKNFRSVLPIDPGLNYYDWEYSASSLAKVYAV